jgi:hypothetical protein
MQRSIYFSNAQRLRYKTVTHIRATGERDDLG